jgi:hypothetical protein
MSYASTLKLPVAQVASYPAGTNSPSQAAKAMTEANAQKLNTMNKLAGGYTKNRKGGATSGTTPIYTPQVAYPDAGAGNNTIQSINSNVTNNYMKGLANKQYDSNALNGPAASSTIPKGGSGRRGGLGGTKKRNGGTRWGCFSGGKSRRIRRTIHTKKSKNLGRRTRRKSGKSGKAKNKIFL